MTCVVTDPSDCGEFAGGDDDVTAASGAASAGAGPFSEPLVSGAGE
jgi:hypothetical protein